MADSFEYVWRTIEPMEYFSGQWVSRYVNACPCLLWAVVRTELYIAFGFGTNETKTVLGGSCMCILVDWGGSRDWCWATRLGTGSGLLPAFHWFISTSEAVRSEWSWYMSRLQTSSRFLSAGVDICGAGDIFF